MSSPVGRPRVSMRQLALFLLAMVVPCLVVVGLGVRMIVQQEELAEKHAADQRRLRVNEFARALEGRLDRIAADPHDPALALVATMVDGELRLPWEARAAGAAPPDAAIQRAEMEEFVTGRLDRAESVLGAALTAARGERERAYLRLIRARVLMKAHRAADANHEYRALLVAPPSATDEDGIPLALYAADRLVHGGQVDEADGEAAAAAVDALTQPAAVMPPAAWYLARAVAEAVRRDGRETDRSRERRLRIARRVADVEHALALKRDFQTLIGQWKVSSAAWLPHGTPLWLIGTSLRAETRDQAVFAVRADTMTDMAQGARLVSANAPGEWLGDRFPGVKAAMPPLEPNAAQRNLQRGFYGAALAVVLSVTVFGGYLLWRDVQREMRLAEMRAQFVSSVSHELKTPLTAIRMFAETLQLDRADAATRVEYLDTIVNESERLTRLLNNVLDFSKIEEGRKTYRRDATPLSDVVRAAARAMAYPLEQHGFVLRVEIDDSLPRVQVDADALEQAILNLLTNAMKYSGTGRTIELRLARAGRTAVISVRDDGIGIPAGEQGRIFEKFYRVPTSANERIPGTGLGLALVAHIVRAHDGSIEVESAPGRGSRFSIVLPLPADPLVPAVVEATS